MSENPLTPITQPETQPDDFDDIIAFQAAGAARRINEAPALGEPAQQPESQPRPININKRGKALIGATLVTGLTAGGIALAGDTLAAPEPSAEKVEHVLQPGEDLYSVVEEIPGVEDPRDAIDSILEDPANAHLSEPGYIPQAGDTYSIPVEFNK